MDDRHATRESWNLATANHNAHKGDQAARLRQGEQLLFEEELDLLGPLEGLRVAHLQCNAGQDTLCLARRAERVVGVDLSDVAVAFARQLSVDAGIPAEFVHGDLLEWLATTDDRFDIAFTSYGTTGWLPDLDAWARGVHRILKPGGALVYVEFHPLVWSFAEQAPFGLTGDDYFDSKTFRDPVGDYVAESGEALGVVAGAAHTVENTIPAASWQYGFARVLQAVVSADLRLERVQEWPYSNGCRLRPGLVPLGGRRWGWPPGTGRVPLMYGIRAART